MLGYKSKVQDFWHGEKWVPITVIMSYDYIFIAQAMIASAFLRLLTVAVVVILEAGFLLAPHVQLSSDFLDH